MSVHRSLVVKGSLARSRNVLTRYERILELKKSGRWEGEESPFALPKLRVPKIKRRGKDKKKKDEGGAK